MFEGRRAVIDVEPDTDRAVLALFSVDGQGLRTLVQAQFDATQVVDFGYPGGVKEYVVVGVDRAGNVSAPADATVGQGGCSVSGVVPLYIALLAVLLRRRGCRPTTAA